MTEHPIKLDDIIRWFESNWEEAISHDVTLGEIKRSDNKYKPSAFADYDSRLFMGRILFWVSGEVDFEMVRISDGISDFHHENVCDINESRLKIAFSAFLQKMSGT
jgi:hypothetical protein